MTKLVEWNGSWEYLITERVTPALPASLEVPSSGWTLGQAPFGTLGNLVIQDGKDINSSWPADYNMWLRRTIDTPEQAPILLTGRIEQGVIVYLDGVYVGGFNVANVGRADTPYWYLVIPAALVTPGSHTLALYCMEDGPGPLDTTYIYCEVEYLPGFLPIPPEVPMKEAVAWKTDVFLANNGSEDRSPLRDIPRRQLQYNIPLNAQEAPRGFNVAYGSQGGTWLLPIWTEGQKLTGNVTAGARTVSGVTTTNYDLRDSSLALLWESPSKWQVIGIERVNLTWLDVTGLNEAFTKPWLIPIRFARPTANSVKSTNGYNGGLTINMELTDNVSVPEVVPTQFLGNDIYFDEGLLGAAMTDDEIIRKMEVHDEALGRVTFRTTWDNTRVSRVYRRVLSGYTEVRDFKKWLQRREGRFRPFWMPSFEADLRLLSVGAVTDSLIVSPDNRLSHASVRTHIAIEATGGVWYARTVTSSLGLSATQVQLTLDSPLSIDASSIQRVCYLGLKRLDTDRIELNWIGGGVVETSIRILELNP